MHEYEKEIIDISRVHNEEMRLRRSNTHGTDWSKTRQMKAVNDLCLMSLSKWLGEGTGKRKNFTRSYKG